MTRRWATAWVILPGANGARKHRVRPDDPHKTLCGRNCSGYPTAPMRGGRTPKGKPCDLCEAKMEREVERDQIPDSGGSSVHAFRGGLPGMGRRR